MAELLNRFYVVNLLNKMESRLPGKPESFYDRCRAAAENIRKYDSPERKFRYESATTLCQELENVILGFRQSESELDKINIRLVELKDEEKEFIKRDIPLILKNIGGDDFLRSHLLSEMGLDRRIK